MSNLMDDFLDRQSKGSELIYTVLVRYRETMGKNCFTENPKTDLQKAMQGLEKWYTREHTYEYPNQQGQHITCSNCGVIKGCHHLLTCHRYGTFK